MGVACAAVTTSGGISIVGWGGSPEESRQEPSRSGSSGSGSRSSRSGDGGGGSESWSVQAGYDDW